MSCFCSPLGTRSLGARQHLSALSSLFHVTDVQRDFDGFSTAQNRTQLFLEEGTRLVALPRWAAGASRTRRPRERGSGRPAHAPEPACLTGARPGRPSRACASWDAEKNLKLAYTLRLSVVQRIVPFFFFFFFRVIAVFVISEGCKCTALTPSRSARRGHPGQAGSPTLQQGTDGGANATRYGK